MLFVTIHPHIASNIYIYIYIRKSALDSRIEMILVAYVIFRSKSLSDIPQDKNHELADK